MNKFLTSGEGTFLPTHCIQLVDSGSENLLFLQITFLPPPRTTAVLSVHWLYQTPKNSKAALYFKTKYCRTICFLISNI